MNDDQENIREIHTGQVSQRMQLAHTASMHKLLYMYTVLVMLGQSH